MGQINHRITRVYKPKGNMLHVTFLSSFHTLGPASEMKEMNQKEDFSSFKYINLLIDIGEMMIVYRVALEGDIFGFSALYSSDFSLFLVLGGCSS